LDVIRSLEDVDVQTTADVPCDVAMEWPDGWIVLGPLKHDVSRGIGVLGLANELNIAHLCIQRVRDDTIPLANSFGKDVEVVTVQMHRMRAELERVLDNESDRRVAAKVEDVPLWREGQVVKLDLGQDRVVVIASEGHVVHEPYEVGTVAAEGNINLLNGGWDHVGGHRAERNSQIERVVTAVVELSGGHVRGSVWSSIDVGVLVIDSGNSFGRNAIIRTTAGEASTQIGSHPIGVTLLSDSLNNDIASLTDTKSNDVGGIWNNWNEIVGNDTEVVSINGKLLDTLGRCVDQPETMFLARLEAELGDTSIGHAWKSGVLARVVHLSVDQVVVRDGNAAVHGSIYQGEVISVIPIGQHDGANINVIWFSLRSLNDDWAESTSGILSAVMGYETD
jgi:hypothetical protein